MSDRFYYQQLNKLGTCPGFNGRKRKMSTWNDELREEAVAQYEEANPTAENSMEIVKQIAEDMEQSANGVRMILTRAGVYIKKTEAAAKAASGATRVSKAASQESLTDAIEDAGQTADQEIISKLTGKAAVYLTEIITAITN